MEIVGADVGGGDAERDDALGFDVDDAFLVLHRAFDEQEAATGCNEPVALEDAGREDDVGDAGFVFERERGKAFGGTGTLAGNDAAGDADGTVMRAMERIAGRAVRFRSLVWFKRAGPLGALDIDGAHAQAVTLGVLDEHGGRVEVHGC